MRQTRCLCLFAAGLLAGCSREKPRPAVVVIAPDEKPATAVVVPAGGANSEAQASALAAGTPQERYDAALVNAIGLVADKKYLEALNALYTARAALDTELVRREIDKVKGLLEQDSAAERAARDIASVLNDGKAGEAAALATTALAQFGDGDASDALERVMRQAEAMTSANLDDAAVRRAVFLAEAEAARRQNNLRAAAVALEQVADDPATRRQLDATLATLARYDEARRRAARLRRDPSQLEDAIAALEEARRAWDTPQIRSDIDDYTFALQQRRDRLGVADFEVRGDLGVPLAGRTVAEALLPGFKPRYDLVEREQIGRVLDELRLEYASLGDDPGAGQEVARLAKLRYLVVGSLTPLNGVTVQARLVEVRTGLVVQTARASAPTLEALLPQLPELARVLMMNDAEKMAFELAQSQQAVASFVPIPLTDPLPPPPPPYAPSDPAPPPLVTYLPTPPALGGLVVQDFAALPPVGVAVATPAVAVVVEDDPRRRRLLALSLEIGDNLFRRGKHREANRHFELALGLTNNRADVQLRIDRCRPYLPPPAPPPVPVVRPAGAAVVAAPQPPPERQRIVVFNFVVNAQPGLVPPAVGEWAADQFASYWGRGYDVVERGEVCWYMGRLGLTLRDVLTDDGARRCLAQALNARYLLFGAIEQTNSFNVSTHMIDAETGAHLGAGMIHVQDHDELKLRMHELARQTGAPPAEQARLAQQGRDSEKVIVEARVLLKSGDHARAAEVIRAALKIAPEVVALQILLDEAERQSKQAATEAACRQEAARRAAEAEANRKRLSELTLAAEAARARAAEEAKTRGAAARQLQEREKQRAYARLEAQGRAALAAGHYPEAVAALQSAVAIQANDDAFRELARARASEETAEQARVAEEKRNRDRAEQRRREEAQARLQQDNRRLQAGEAARRAQRERDIAEANHLTEQARQALAKQDFAAALAAASSAARLHDDPATHALVEKVRQEQELAEARKKGEQARAEAERKLAEEKARREKEEAELHRKQDAYNAALARAQKALGERQYDAAIGSFQEAAKLYRTDAALNGLKQAEQARDHERALAEAEQRRKAEEVRRAARVKELADAGRQALEAKQFDKAVQSFQEASKLAPADVDLRAALAKAEQSREQAKEAATAAARQREEEARAEKVRPLVAAAREAIAARDFDTAGKSLGAANKLEPGEPTVLKAAQELAAARQAQATAEKAQKQRLADYQLAMEAGRSAERAKNYTGAVNAYTEALRILPNDPVAGKALRDARAALAAAKNPPKPAASAPPPPSPATEYARRMQQGSELEKQKRYAEAASAFREALKFMPGDAKATEAVRVNEFAEHLGEAGRLHREKKFAEAVKEYQEALKRSPNDEAVKKLLQKAKENKLP